MVGQLETDEIIEKQQSDEEINAMNQKKSYEQELNEVAGEENRAQDSAIFKMASKLDDAVELPPLDSPQNKKQMKRLTEEMSMDESMKPKV